MVRPAMLSLLFLALLGVAPAVAETADPTVPLGSADAAQDPRRAAREGVFDRERLGERAESLIRRPDRRRPEERLSVDVFGRPLTIGGRYQIGSEAEFDRLLDFDFLDLDAGGVPEDFAEGKVPLEDRVKLDQEFQLDLFYSFTDSIAGYVEAQVNWNNRLYSSVEGSFDEWFVTFKEAWVYVADIGGSPVSLQVGRQRVTDEREWWWDENHDVIRLHADGEKFHAELGVMQRVMPIRSGEPFTVDPEERDLLRVFGSAVYEWAPRQQVTVRALYQHDSSAGHVALGPTMPCVRDFLPMDGVPDDPPPDPFFLTGCIDKEDESDADLLWLGISADGRWRPEGWGRARLYYWLEAAAVTGEEEFARFRGQSFERSVSQVTTTQVAGFGLDVGATLQGDGVFQPNVTLGYAYGSGRKGTAKGRDRGFRQTGLQDNADKFRGVTSLRYYGFLFEPELSNLHVVTLGTGFRFLPESSVDLIYHYYRQDVASELLRDVGFKRDPNGFDTDLGHELDLVVGIEDFDPVEVRLLGAVFRTGEAFAPKAGEFAYLTSIRIRVNF